MLDVDLDRERVSLSLKATQEDPWRQFARTHQIGQVVPGRVTKLVPFGAFVRVDEGIEGLVHISELAERHVEIPEQVVQVGDEILVKVIDIDLERRRISLSLKQANEGTHRRGEPASSTRRVRHGGAVRRGGQLHLPRGLRPGDRGVAARASRRSARPGRSSTPRRTPATRRTSSRCEEAKKADAEATGEHVVLLRRTGRRPAARWPRTRRSRRCGRSSPAVARSSCPTEAPPGPPGGASAFPAGPPGGRASGTGAPR